MTTTCKFKRIKLYINTEKEALAEVMAKTGATHGSNGGFYNVASFAPVMRLKCNGQMLATDEYPLNMGYAWDSSSGRLVHTDAAGAKLYDNFLTAVRMITDHEKQTMYYSKEVGGTRGRTGIGTMDDGTVVWYVAKDGSSGAKSPEALREYFHGLGVRDAVMLDGGGSSQCVFAGSKITSDRKVHNYILAWEDKPVKNKYAVPTKAIKKGAKGNNVRWLQTMLRELGAYIDVDGSFGPATDAALRRFQEFWALDVDGSCGPLTRARLAWSVALVDKGIRSGATPAERLASTLAYEIGTVEPSGDDKYINWYNAACGTSFSLSVDWCAILQSWGLRRAKIDVVKAPCFHSCTAAMTGFQERSQWRTEPAFGRLVFYDWDGDGKGLANHVGLVVAVSGGKILVVEGNTSDAVRLRERSISDKTIRGYADIY